MYSASLRDYYAKFSNIVVRISLCGSQPFYYILQFKDTI